MLVMDSKLACDRNAPGMLIEETGTEISTSDEVGIFVRAWIPDNPQRVVICAQGLGGHGGYYSELAKGVAVSGTIVIALIGLF
jgi:alpha-beta hydrolase superfamily lysophospholipase